MTNTNTKDDQTDTYNLVFGILASDATFKQLNDDMQFQVCKELAITVLELIKDWPKADAMSAQCRETFPVGTKVRLKMDVERYDSFIAKAGATGTVTCNDEHMLAVKMDESVKVTIRCGGCNVLFDWPTCVTRSELQGWDFLQYTHNCHQTYGALQVIDDLLVWDCVKCKRVFVSTDEGIPCDACSEPSCSSCLRANHDKCPNCEAIKKGESPSCALSNPFEAAPVESCRDEGDVNVRELSGDDSEDRNCATCGHDKIYHEPDADLDYAPCKQEGCSCDDWQGSERESHEAFWPVDVAPLAAKIEKCDNCGREIDRLTGDTACACGDLFPATTEPADDEHLFAAKVAFGEDCRHCDKNRREHKNRPDVFEEADAMDAMAAASVGEQAQPRGKSTPCMPLYAETIAGHSRVFEADGNQLALITANDLNHADICALFVTAVNSHERLVAAGKRLRDMLLQVTINTHKVEDGPMLDAWNELDAALTGL